MNRVILGLLALLALASSVPAQQQTLPASTVVGRLAIGPGPAQAIPFATLSGILFGSGSGVFGLTLSGNTNYVMVATDRTVLINAALTASRTVTLFAAATLATGQQICIADAFGGVTSANTLVIARSASDTINGATSYVVGSAFGGVCLISDGVSKWTNSNSLPQVPANTVKCNPITSTANPIDCSYPTINVKDYGAIGNGAADDTTAIQNAINALPTSGGEVVFPVGNYKITTALTIGDGTGAAASTRAGVVLRGYGNPTTEPVFGGFTATGGPKITYAGSATNSIINVKGPLQGWGIQNLYLDCASIASVTGVTVTSAQFGDNRNLSIVNCFRGIASSTVAPFGSFSNTDSYNNKWYQTNIVVPATAGAMGILLTGAAATANSDYNTFTNTDIFLPTSVVVALGIYLQVADTNHFYNTHIYGGNASAGCVTFDYGVANQFPSSNRFTGIDVATCGGGTTWNPSGTPGAGAKPNVAYIDEANGGLVPNIVNLMAVGSSSYVTSPGGNNAGTNILGAWTTFTPTYVCGTATFTNNSSRRLTMGKTTHIQIEFTITAIGTCAANLTFTLPNTAQSSAGLAGLELALNNNVGVCTVASASATGTCKKHTGGVFLVNEHFVFSGVYENQ